MHRLLAKACLIMVCVVGPQMAHAQAPKIGYVNSAKLFVEAPQAKEANDRLVREFEPRKEVLLELKNALRDDETAFIKGSALMSAEQRNKKERDLINRQRELKLKETEFGEEVAIRRSSEMEKVQNFLRGAIQDYGKEKNYDIIFFEGVSYASERVDITDEIIERLGK